jgi:hypothetical protein
MLLSVSHLLKRLYPLGMYQMRGCSAVRAYTPLMRIGLRTRFTFLIRPCEEIYVILSHHEFLFGLLFCVRSCYFFSTSVKYKPNMYICCAYCDIKHFVCPVVSIQVRDLATVLSLWNWTQCIKIVMQFHTNTDILSNEQRWVGVCHLFSSTQCCSVLCHMILWKSVIENVSSSLWTL